MRPLATTTPPTTAWMEMRAHEAQAEGRRLRHEQRWVPYGRVAPDLRRAVLLAEDAAFWRHDGIDIEQIRASMEINLDEGRAVRGASTITQQLAKNLYLSPSRNPVRKARELMIARRLEAELSKRRILELYLNLIEWGDGVWGAEAASRRYFGVSASALTAEQAALLAAAIVNPRALNPARPTPRLLRRQRLILRRLGVTAPPPVTPVVMDEPARAEAPAAPAAGAPCPVAPCDPCPVPPCEK